MRRLTGRKAGAAVAALAIGLAPSAACACKNCSGASLGGASGLTQVNVNAYAPGYTSTSQQTKTYGGSGATFTPTSGSGVASAPALTPWQIVVGQGATAINTTYCNITLPGIIKSLSNSGSCATGGAPAAAGVAPAAPQVKVISATVLAQRAEKQMRLVPADAMIAPPPTFHTYIGIQNWLWIPRSEWHSEHVSVSAGPTTVTATAGPIEVKWDMGNGQTKYCFDAGRPWTKSLTNDNEATSSCSYAYTTLKHPNGDKYKVSARLVYGVKWTCKGRCTSRGGSLGNVTAPAGKTTTIKVRQRQTVVTQ